MTGNSKIHQLTILRFFAAYLVFLFHLLPHVLGTQFLELPIFVQRIVNKGYVSVSFFYLLSGFVLYITYAQYSLQNIKEIYNFSKKRFARIAPVFYLSLALGAPLFYVDLIKNSYAYNVDLFFILSFLVNLLFLGAWFPSTLGFNYPGWSISVEAFFYANFPWLLPKVKSSNMRQIFIFLIGSYFFMLFLFYLSSYFWPVLSEWKANEPSIKQPNHHPWVSNFFHINPIVHIPAFIWGLCIGRFYQIRNRNWDIFGIKIFISGILVFTLVLLFGDSMPHLALNSFLLLPLSSLIIWGAAVTKSINIPIKLNVLLVSLGEASYALYILHVPIRDWFFIFSKKIYAIQPLTSIAIQLVFMPVISLFVYFVIESRAKRILFKNRS